MAEITLPVVGLCGSDPNLADLVACYQLDEGSGTAFLDGAENTVFNDGATVGGPAWVTGISGTALAFDGATQYGSAPDDASLDITGQLTLAAWVKQSATTTSPTQLLVAKGTNSANSGYQLGLADAPTRSTSALTTITQTAGSIRPSTSRPIGTPGCMSPPLTTGPLSISM